MEEKTPFIPHIKEIECNNLYHFFNMVHIKNKKLDHYSCMATEWHQSFVC